MSINELRQQVCQANKALPELGLVVMHSGNASGYDPQSKHLLIKPSGIDYHTLTPDMLVEIDVPTGQKIAGKLRPSVDLPHHLYLYRNMPNIRGIVHTHSNHATAFAACNKPIPLYLTAIADEFGDQIPCTPYVDNTGDNIGHAILKHANDGPAVLLGNHGVFTWGPTPSAAIKAAAMVEDVARTIILATQIGKPVQIPAEEALKWRDRYTSRYGQPDNPEHNDKRKAA